MANHSYIHNAILSTILLLLLNIGYSQDIIETKSGEKIAAKVVHIGETEIKYKKHDNVMDPMQSIELQEVIVINFANGKVRRFVELPKPVSKMLQPEKHKVENNNKSVIWEYQFDTEPVFGGTTIYYYGIDMSHLVMVNADKSNEDDHLRHYFTSWQEKFDEIITSELLKRGMRTTKVVMKNIKTKFTYEGIQNDWIRNSWDGLTIEDVIIIAREFGKTIEAQKGIGLLFISDGYYQSKNEVSTIALFFDATSKEVLWASKFKGLAGDKEMIKKWGMGMVRSYQRFRLDVYEKQYKKYVKAKYAEKQEIDNPK